MAKLELVRPTPERLAKAERCHYSERNAAGKIIGATMVFDAPFERLYERKAVDRRQYDAGQKFHRHWYGAGMNPVKAIDYARTNAEGYFRDLDPGEALEHHTKQYRLACQELGIRGQVVVQAIICEGREPAAVGRLFGWANDAQARAVSIDRLREGLDTLAKMWGIDA